MERLYHAANQRPVLVDPAGDHFWHLAGEIDLPDVSNLEGSLLRLRYLGK